MGGPAISQEKVEQVKAMLLDGKTMEHIENATGVSVSTVYRISKKSETQKELKSAKHMDKKLIAELDILHDRYGSKDDLWKQWDELRKRYGKKYVS